MPTPVKDPVKSPEKNPGQEPDPERHIKKICPEQTRRWTFPGYIFPA